MVVGRKETRGIMNPLKQPPFQLPGTLIARNFSPAAFYALAYYKQMHPAARDDSGTFTAPPCAPHSHLLDTQTHLILCKVTHEPYCSVTRCFWLSRACQPWISIPIRNLFIYIFPLILLILLCVVSTWFSSCL